LVEFFILSYQNDYQIRSSNGSEKGRVSQISGKRRNPGNLDKISGNI
jgi:hypothetical protein